MKNRRTVLYYVLEQLHVLPNVSYLAKIRNTDRHVGLAAADHGEHAPAAEVKAEEKKAEAAH